MIIFAKTNGHYYNMVEIESFEKSGETEIVFHFANGNKSVESYADTDTRDKVFANLESEFVKDCDS